MSSDIKPTIMIIDDVPKNIDMLIEMLAPIDCEIAVATSGTAALEIIDSVSPDLVLLDVQMPIMDGYQTCQKIKQLAEFRDLPVIFVTAKTDICDLKTGFEVGCVDYIRKPIQQEEVIARVRTHLRLQTLTSELQEHNQQLSAILDTVMEGTFCVGGDGMIDSANQAALKELGYNMGDLIGQPVGFLIPDFGTTDKDWKNSAIYSVCLQSGGEYYSENHSFKRSDGSEFSAEFTAAPLNDSNGNSFGAIIAFRDITERKESHKQLVSLMSTDQLTGLVNWSEFSRKLAEAISDTRESGDEIVLYLLDIDNFRDINDTLGHDAGDLLLTKIADRLRDFLPEDVLITRLGGDEFALFRSYPHGTLDIDAEAENVLNIVNHTYSVMRNKIYVCSSLGLVVKGKLPFSADDMIRAADVAVYRAKQAGKSSYEQFTHHMQSEVLQRTKKVNAIRLALEKKAFLPYFQPLINASNGTIIGAEALTRWMKNGIIVSPNEFIREAENSGMISELSCQIYSESFKAASQWNRQGHDTYIAVNVSAKQLQRKGFVEEILELTEEHGLACEKLVLEITESVFMSDIDTVSAIFDRLRQMGVRIAIDDFGTGFSSLSYLTRIRADILKIDQSFIQDIGIDNAQETIVRTIINMAHSLDMIVVAEGVETEQQISYLQQHHCDIFQGYYYGKPEEGSGFSQKLTSSSSPMPV